MEEGHSQKQCTMVVAWRCHCATLLSVCVPAWRSPVFTLWWDSALPLFFRGHQNQKPGAGRGGDAQPLLQGRPCHFETLNYHWFFQLEKAFLRRWLVEESPRALILPSKTVLRCFEGAKPHVCSQCRMLTIQGQAFCILVIGECSARRPGPNLH